MPQYTFKNVGNNVEVYQNGQRVSTGTAAYAASKYGYTPTAPTMATPTGLSAADQAAVAKAAQLGGTSLTPITPSNLTSNEKPINATYGGLSANDYQALIQAALAGAQTPVADTTPRPEDTTTQRISELMGGITNEKPESYTDIYNKQINSPEYLAKQKMVDDLTAQLNAVNAESKAKDLFAGGPGGVGTAGALNVTEVANARDLAIKTLPITAQLNAAQGRLESAQQNITTLLDLQEKDQNAYRQWYNDFYNQASDIADKEYQAKLDAWLEKKDAADKVASDLLEIKKTYIAEAIQQGDYATASKIAAGKTTEEVNTLASQIKAKAAETWSAPYLLGGDYVQKNSNTGEIRTAVNVPVTSSDKPLSILDVQRYNELYPEANIIVGDTEKTANDKVAQINTPEAKTRSLVQSAKDAGNSYDVVVNEIKNDATIKDKETAIKIADEVFGKTATTPTTPQYGTGNFSKIDIATRKQELEKMGFTASQVKAQLKADGYPIDAIASVGAGNLIDQLSTWIFKE